MSTLIIMLNSVTHFLAEHISYGGICAQRWPIWWGKLDVIFAPREKKLLEKKMEHKSFYTMRDYSN